MGSYKISVKESAERELRGIPFPFRRTLAHAVNALTREPRPGRCEALTRPGAYRIRLAGYRIVYTVDESAGLVRVFRIAR